MQTQSHAQALSAERAVSRPMLKPRAWRELAQIAAEALVAGLVVALVLAVAAFIVATDTRAATREVVDDQDVAQSCRELARFGAAPAEPCVRLHATTRSY